MNFMYRIWALAIGAAAIFALFFVPTLNVIEGVLCGLVGFPALYFALFGSERQIEELRKKHGWL